MFALFIILLINQFLSIAAASATGFLLNKVLINADQTTWHSFIVRLKTKELIVSRNNTNKIKRITDEKWSVRSIILSPSKQLDKKIERVSVVVANRNLAS